MLNLNLVSPPIAKIGNPVNIDPHVVELDSSLEHEQQDAAARETRAALMRVAESLESAVAGLEEEEELRALDGAAAAASTRSEPSGPGRRTSARRPCSGGRTQQRRGRGGSSGSWLAWLASGRSNG